MLDVVRLNRRPLLIVAAVLTSLIAFVVGAALVIHASRTSTDAAKNDQPGEGRHEVPASVPTIAAPASDVESWNAIVPIKPEVSSAYPAIRDSVRNDPSAFASAFATDLFSRSYGETTRMELISWAQYENAPLKSQLSGAGLVQGPRQLPLRPDLG